jgi:hypothetical protein
MKPYNQIVDIELTTDQVLLVLAMIATCTANISEWMKQNPDNKESIDEIADTVKDIRKLKEVFDNARIRIEESWGK